MRNLICEYLPVRVRDIRRQCNRPPHSPHHRSPHRTCRNCPPPPDDSPLRLFAASGADSGTFVRFEPICDRPTVRCPCSARSHHTPDTQHPLRLSICAANCNEGNLCTKNNLQFAKASGDLRIPGNAERYQTHSHSGADARY